MERCRDFNFSCFAVGRRWTHPRVLWESEGGGDALAPVGGEALPHPAGRELEPCHAGGGSRVLTEPLSWDLEGKIPEGNQISLWLILPSGSLWLLISHATVLKHSKIRQRCQIDGTHALNDLNLRNQICLNLIRNVGLSVDMCYEVLFRSTVR